MAATKPVSLRPTDRDPLRYDLAPGDHMTFRPYFEVRIMCNETVGVVA